MREIINSKLTCQVVVSLVTSMRRKKLYNWYSKESTYNICFVCLFFFSMILLTYPPITKKNGMRLTEKEKCQ